MTQRERDRMTTQPWVAPMLLWQQSMQQAFRLQLAFFEQMREFWSAPMTAGRPSPPGGTQERELIQLPEAQTPATTSPSHATARETAAATPASSPRGGRRARQPAGRR